MKFILIAFIAVITTVSSIQLSAQRSCITRHMASKVLVKMGLGENPKAIEAETFVTAFEQLFKDQGYKITAKDKKWLRFKAKKLSKWSKWYGKGNGHNITHKTRYNFIYKFFKMFGYHFHVCG